MMRAAGWARYIRTATGLIGLALFSGCQEETPVSKQPLRVGVAVAQMSDFAPEIVLTGEVAARVTSELSFRVSGRIIERGAEVGDRVSAEQALARIDAQEQRANLDAARAAVQAAEAQLRQASSTFERQKTLIRQGYTTRREYDAAEEAFRSAQGALDVARAQLGTAEDQLAQTVLRPAVAGVITARHAEAGQVVQAAQSVFTLAQDGPRDAVFNVYESLFTNEPAGDTIEVALVSDARVSASATVREVSPTVDPGTGTVRVKFQITDPPSGMTLGAPLVGTGRLKSRPGIILPWSALTSAGNGAAVWIYDAATKAVSLKPINVTAYGLGTFLVNSGIEPGQSIVTRGQQLLRPGQIVEPVAEPS